MIITARDFPAALTGKGDQGRHADAKARLSHYLGSVEHGETVVLCRRNVPIAEIRPIPKPLTEPRPVGTDPDFEVPESFFEPLPEELLRAFGGGDISPGSTTTGREEDDPVERPKQQSPPRRTVAPE